MVPNALSILGTKHRLFLCDILRESSRFVRVLHILPSLRVCSQYKSPVRDDDDKGVVGEYRPTSLALNVSSEIRYVLVIILCHLWHGLAMTFENFFRMVTSNPVDVCPDTKRRRISWPECNELIVPCCGLCYGQRGRAIR